MAPLNQASEPYNMNPNALSAMLGGTAAFPLSFSPDTPARFRLNTKTHMSSLRPTLPMAMTFPPLRSPPKNLPIRPGAQTPALKALDKIYDQQPHPIYPAQGLKYGYNEEMDESCNNEALKVLEKHINDREPYAQLSSRRLQAALGLNNENVFDLPELPARSLSPSMKTLYEMPQGFDTGGMKAKNAARRGGSLRDNESGFGSLGNFAPKSPLGIHLVDKESGKGLREFLLAKGKECGQRKLECKSISFHDFTPEMKSGVHRNVLLGHYGVEKGERTNVYEVDLPTISVDSETGDEIHHFETWIWILLSRPLVSLDGNDTSTRTALDSSPLQSPASTMFYTPHSRAPSVDDAQQAIDNPTTPPNFPHPTPLSWLVFAAPKAHIVEYDVAVENFSTAANSKTGTNINIDNATMYPFAKTTATKMIQKRCDYDFSFSGIPIFEFSTLDMFNYGKMKFLSVEGIGGWCENDPYAEYGKEEYKRLCGLQEGDTGKSNSNSGTYNGGEGNGGGDGDGDDGDGCDNKEHSGKSKGKGAVLPPNRGTWWNVFYKRMYEDCSRWEKIRAAMANGKCRVVVRWLEAVDQDQDQDLEMRDVRSAFRGKVGKGKGGGIGGRGKRLTRAESRRRSGLGIGMGMVDLFGGLGNGTGALGESARARALGNRDLGLGLGGGGEKDKKIKKR